MPRVKRVAIIGWSRYEDPSAASVQHRWWELDLSYYEIKFLELLGLASDVIPPRHRRQGHIDKLETRDGKPAARADATENISEDVLA